MASTEGGGLFTGWRGALSTHKLNSKSPQWCRWQHAGCGLGPDFLNSLIMLVGYWPWFALRALVRSQAGSFPKVFLERVACRGTLAKPILHYFDSFLSCLFSFSFFYPSITNNSGPHPQCHNTYTRNKSATHFQSKSIASPSPAARLASADPVSATTFFKNATASSIPCGS